MKAKAGSRVDVVKKLREISPAGTTGEIIYYSSLQYEKRFG